MFCLDSFSIKIIQSRTFAVAGTNVKSWGAAGNYHWGVQQSGVSVFDIQGFKNIDIYGVKMNGFIETDLSAGDSAIVSDYAFKLSFGGQVPLISGVVDPSPNFWGISKDVTGFYLGKYNSEAKFETPYVGCTSISFDKFSAEGNNGETLNSVSLNMDLSFTFYYMYK
jgi:hypothetical protein